MKIITTLFTFLIGTLSLNAQDSWYQVDSINGDPRAAATAFKVGLYAYVATGLEEYGLSGDTVLFFFFFSNIIK